MPNKQNQRRQKNYEKDSKKAAAGEATEEDTPFPLVTLISNFLLSLLTIIEVYIIDQDF